MKMDSIASKYKVILKQTQCYLLSFPGNLEHYDLTPFGKDISKENQLSCISAKNERFYDLLHSLDAVAFGPMGMPMEKWVFYDCGEMPGGIFGFSVTADKLTDEGLKEYDVTPDFKGIIPISMYVSIPMATKGHWFGHNLSSANRVLKDKLPGLGLLTKAYALKAFNINNMYGATQWDSKALHIHLQLADMEIISAYTPAHTFKNTMTYKSYYDDQSLIERLNGIKRESKNYDFLYPSDDVEYSKNFQKKIEDGERYIITGRPMMENKRTVYPVKKI